MNQRDHDLLRLGQPPEDSEVISSITVGGPVWEDFIREHYLAPGGYVAEGYSQMKIVTGRPGAGKTHLLRRLETIATDLGYIPVPLSATAIRLQNIDSVYSAIAAKIDLAGLASRLADHVVTDMGYNPPDVPRGFKFAPWLVQQHNRIDVLVNRDIETILGRLFRGERVDPNFSLSLIQLASDCLGAHPLTEEDRSSLYRWLQGGRLKAEELQRVHLSRSIDRFNARDMLHALADFIRQRGYKGLFVSIDEMEDLPLGRATERNRFKYGGVALADAYQSLRELVDDLPRIPGLFIVLAGQTDFLELPRGVKSYDALWLRIQHEIVSPLFNRFAQVVDLDRAIRIALSYDDVEELQTRLRSLGLDVRPLDQQATEAILAMAAGEGIYRRLVKAMLNEGEG